MQIVKIVRERWEVLKIRSPQVSGQGTPGTQLLHTCLNAYTFCITVAVSIQLLSNTEKLCWLQGSHDCLQQLKVYPTDPEMLSKKIQVKTLHSD